MLIVGISTSAGQFTIVAGEAGHIALNSDDLQLPNNNDISVLFSSGFQLPLKDISQIIVDVGPGGTSRVRTGVAFANSLAYSLGIPVCPVPSLELAGLDAWERYRLPAICTVKSVKGNAFIGLYDAGRLVRIEHGKIEDIVPGMTAGMEAFATVGYHREGIANLFPDKTVQDSGLLFGNATWLVEKSELFLERAVSFPHFAAPITDADFTLKQAVAADAPE